MSGQEQKSTTKFNSSCTQSVIVKKYSCMYTADIQKHRKVWHDGVLRMRHMNSKVYLLSQDGHPLAECFLKVSPSRFRVTQGESDRMTYMKVPSEFRLDEDEEVEFDPLEDSEVRSCSYIARIVDLIKVEIEEVPSLTSLNLKTRQELHKRKMEYLDQTILQLSKRSKPAPHPQTSPMSNSICPLTPVPSSSRRQTGGFQTRPFNSPLIDRSKPSHSVYPSTTPSKALRNFSIEPCDDKLKRSIPKSKGPLINKSKSSHPINQSIKTSQPIHDPSIEPCGDELDQSILKSQGPLINKFKPSHSINQSTKPSHPLHNTSVEPCDHKFKRPIAKLEAENKNLESDVQLDESIQPDCKQQPSSLDRISRRKTLKIDWDSFFESAKSS